MAKIKTPRTGHHHTKPRSLNRRAFERVYWPYIPLVLVISLLLGLGATSGNLQAYVRHPGGRVLAYADSMTISGLLADTNASRSANGVSALSLNEKLDAAAQASADDMAARNYWSHYTPDGNPPWIWVTAQGYAYQKLGQNLATGFADEQSTIDGWMNSPPHRENLLDPSFTEVGFGFANNPNYTAAGGGPMTIIVAFYGDPQVLAAATPTQPAASQPSAPTASAPAPTESQPVQQSTASPSAEATKPSEKPVNTSADAKVLSAPPLKQSRIQLALANSKLAPVATSFSILAALLIFVFWSGRHLLAIRKFLLKGERYAISHPLTDIALLVIACLLFILSQTAGLVR
jgi:cell division septation protein DedD